MVATFDVWLTLTPPPFPSLPSITWIAFSRTVRSAARFSPSSSRIAIRGGEVARHRLPSRSSRRRVENSRRLSRCVRARFSRYPTNLAACSSVTRVRRSRLADLACELFEEVGAREIALQHADLHGPVIGSQWRATSRGAWSAGFRIQQRAMATLFRQPAASCSIPKASTAQIRVIARARLSETPPTRVLHPWRTRDETCATAARAKSGVDRRRRGDSRTPGGGLGSAHDCDGARADNAQTIYSL
jgi:hypothetical protein